MRVERTQITRLAFGDHRSRKTAVIALLLSMAAQVRASEGYISLYYNVEGVGESSYTLNHSAGAAEGLDDQDIVWYFIACVNCKTDTKAVSSIDGKHVKIDRRPIHSESGATVYCSAVSKNGDPITLDNAAQWVNVFMHGFDGYDVYVNDCDARATDRIDLSPVTGTYSSGSTLETLDIRFSRRPGYDPGDPPSPPEPGPDPSDGAQPAPTKPVPDALFITNSIEGCPREQTGVWTLTLHPEARDAVDAHDVAHVASLGQGFTSVIASAITDLTTGERRLLAVDARPPDSKADIDLSVAVESASGEPVRFPWPSQNKLIFRFPVQPRDSFTGRPLTFQQYDPVHPDVPYPVWDIRRIVDSRQGALPLADLTEYRSSGIPYLRARVSTSRLPGDVLRDGRIDLADYDLVASREGFDGPTDADVASPEGLGLPDGTVDVWDLHYLYESLSDADKAQVTPPALPVAIEGFETGALDILSWHCLQWPRWFVTTEDSHTGTCSARAGRIGDGEITSLTLTIDCTAGTITFWRRVSSEPNWDVYRFFIGGHLQETLSGNVPWSEASFPVSAGLHTFRWEYEKDDSISHGQDTVYLDDIRIPAVSAVAAQQ